MKILWFTNIPVSIKNDIKGTGTWLNSLLAEIEKNLELTVCYYGLNDNCFGDNNISHIVLKRNKYKYFLPPNFKKEQNLKKYLNIVDNVKPDIIHIHGTENDFINILDFKYKLPPIVISIQGNLTIIKKFYFRGFSPLHCLLTFNLKYIFYYILFTHLSKYEKRAMSNLNYVFGRTDWDYRITRALSPSSQYYKVDEILRNEFYFNEWSYLNRKKIIIFTTSGDALYKGIEVIFQTATILNHLDFDFEWRIAGVSNQSKIFRLLKFYSINKIPNNLTFLGPLNSGEIVNEMLQSNLYINTSHIENSPNSLCEALLLGMPCISSMVGGIGSLISDGIDGILIQDGDPWVLSGTIINLKNDVEKLITIGRNARLRALLRHNKEKIVKDLLDGYNKII